MTVEGLASHFGVAVQTIRRDLSELAESGQLNRVHGGAVLPAGPTNMGYTARTNLHADAKRSIARACAGEIPDSASLFLNIGTSTEAVARELLNHRDLLVVTNNINVANILAGNPNCEVIVAGGSLRRSDGGLVGVLAIRTIEQFKFDYAVIGCSALDEDGDLMDYDLQEVVVSQTIIRQSKRALLVADASKFQRSAPMVIDSLASIDTLFTDRPVPGALVERCETWGTQLQICPPEDDAAT